MISASNRDSLTTFSHWNNVRTGRIWPLVPWSNLTQNDWRGLLRVIIQTTVALLYCNTVVCYNGRMSDTISWSVCVLRAWLSAATHPGSSTLYLRDFHTFKSMQLITSRMLYTLCHTHFVYLNFTNTLFYCQSKYLPTLLLTRILYTIHCTRLLIRCSLGSDRQCKIWKDVIQNLSTKHMSSIAK